MKNQTAIYAQVSQIRRDNQFNQWADKLDQLIEEVNQDSSRDRAAQEIRGLCSVRLLGDLNIKTINGWEWNKKLEKLKKYVNKKAAS